MKTLILALAATALSSTLVLAQTSTTGGVSAGAGVSAGGVNAGANAGVNAGATAGSNDNSGSGNTNGNNGSNGSANGTTTTPGSTDNTGVANGTNTNANGTTTDDTNAAANAPATAKASKADCTAMGNKIHSGSGEWTEAQSKPYIDKMMAMKMSTKMQGRLTNEEFMSACETGAFSGM